MKKRKRKNENTPKSLFHCVCRRYWRSKIVSTEAPARAAGSGFVFPWAGPKPLVGRHEGPAGLGPNRLGPARLTALSRACTSLILAFSGLSKRPPLGGKRWLTNWIHGGHAMMMYRIMTDCGHNFPRVEVLVLTLTLGSLDWTSRTVPITTFCTLFLTTLLRYI